MPALSEELYLSLRYRLNNLEQELNDLTAVIGESRSGLARALEITSLYPAWIRDIAEKEWNRASDEEARVGLVMQLLEQIKDRTEFVDDWFRTGLNLRIPVQLLRAVERSCAGMGLGDRWAVLAAGGAANFETFITDIADELFETIDPWPGPPLPADAPSFALMRVPLFEGGEAFWLPIVCGHEVAHLAIAADLDIVRSLASQLDLAALKGLDVPKLPELEDENSDTIALWIATNWIEEILCDLNASRLYGPSGIAALLEFLSFAGAVDKPSETHPPGWLRAAVLLGKHTPPSSASLRGILEPWTELASVSHRPPLPVWADRLTDEMLRLADALFDAVSGWPEYPWREREEVIDRAKAQLDTGLPPHAEKPPSGEVELFDADVINAAWVRRHSELAGVRMDEALGTTVRLCAKSLDSLEFLRQWHEHGGKEEPLAETVADRGAVGMLSNKEIIHRLHDGPPSGLAVTPLLDEAIGAGGIDVRLGSRFITFRRSETASFDPLSSEDPRAMHSLVEKAWGESYIVHPHELVLATTLEYIWLPPDLAAQVITRSSLGRLGLITATAIEVNPGFRGCLTLELVNLGEVPIHLIPGARIAQLVLFKVDPPADVSKSRYDCPTGPEFSKVREDQDLQILRGLRERFAHSDK